MKKIYTIVLSVFFFAIVQAQTWNCFPPNQKSYYQFNRWSVTSIDLIVQDSLVVTGLGTKLLFRRAIQNPGAESCRSELFPLCNPNYSPYFLDSLELNSDTLTYIFGNDTVYFLQNVQPGQSWGINPSGLIGITCDSVRSELIFGQLDSVKYFHTLGINPPNQIRQSKRFGFLDFIYFNELGNSLATPYHLAGAQDLSGTYGFQPPQFFDYLPYHVGDILKWDWWHDGSPTWTWSYHFTYHDSITQVSLYQDSLVYEYDRIIVDSGNHVSYWPAQTEKFTRNRFGNLLNSPAGDVGISGFDDNLFSSESFILNSSYYNIGADTVQVNNWIERNFSWFSNDLDSPCTVVQIIDGISPYYLFNTHQGLVQDWEYGQGFNLFTTLIGARINGVVYGDPDIDTGIEGPASSPISIYPNPCVDIVTVKTGNRQYDRFEIHDIFGRLLTTEPCLSDLSRINLSQFPSGVYLLKCIGKNSVTEKIVKY